MIRYRTFRNSDPPVIAAIWNECCTGRGACQLRQIAPLERAVFSKLYFDPQGLIVAYDDDTPVGFIHAGFGPNESQSQPDRHAGVICAVCVRPTYQRRGVGGELLRHAEAYLKRSGATAAWAGPRRPLNPFYFSMYGGSDSPGFLLSDFAAKPFFEHFGYAATTCTHVFQRRLDKPLTITDPRFAPLRKRYEVVIQPRLTLNSWWLENVVGSVEPVEIRLEERTSREVAGRALVWEMEGFSWRWNVPAAGILDLIVRDDLRRLGLGRFFVAHVVRYLQEQYFGICECQAEEGNAAGRSLLVSMQFEIVDEGYVYRRTL